MRFLSKTFGLILIFLAIYFPDLPVQAKYGGGSGEPNDPYLIYTAEQMNAIGADQNDWDKHFKLMADINLSAYNGTNFNIIGLDSNKFFSGVFDGNDKEISNFSYYSSTETANIGLFGYVDGENAQIKNLGLINPDVNVPAGWDVGSLVGRKDDGAITNCFIEGGSASGIENVGGLVGYNYGGEISNCYSLGNVTGNYDNVGGLVGKTYGRISDCYVAGNVTGMYDDVGGLVGWTHADICNCYAEGIVSGRHKVGGLIGNTDAIFVREYKVTNCYSGAVVLADVSAGGLVGQNGYHVPISHCYSTGLVLWPTDAGGLVGSNGGTVKFSFWDVETSGQTTSAGGVGKTTAEMKQKTTFTNWDFTEVWGIAENQTYPFLRWCPAGDINGDCKVDFIDLVIMASHWLE